MNISTYIFGSFEKGYSQYPNDYTLSIFKNFYSYATSPTQIAVHREDRVMHYGYIRKLDGNKYIGLCVVLNSVMLTDFKALFSAFEDVITYLVANGHILQFNEHGDIISKTDQLFKEQSDVSHVTDFLHQEIDKLQSKSQLLPPINYSIARNEHRSFTIDDDANEITKASTAYSYIVVYKDRNFDTQFLKSSRGVIHRLKKDKEEIEQKYDNLKGEYQILQNKQRNTLWVGILFVAVAVLSSILYFKVINPSEVTHYETGEFIYYGPMKKGKPDGLGVAIYPDNDRDDRRYYVGRFAAGVPRDTAAMLYYKNGDYFYGEILDTCFVKGIQYVNSDNSYFRGTFDENCNPYDGIWYDYNYSYKVVKGKDTK